MFFILNYIVSKSLKYVNIINNAELATVGFKERSTGNRRERFV